MIVEPDDFPNSTSDSISEFKVRVQTQDRLLAALRRCCKAVPDRRHGKNTTYAMADFVLAAFAPFFLQSPSFLAHQRHLETGHAGLLKLSRGSLYYKARPVTPANLAIMRRIDELHLEPLAKPG